MDKKSLKERFELTFKIVDEVSDFLLSHEELRHNITEKAENDYVTIADKKSEDLIEKSIRSSFPEDSLFGEENGKIGSDASRMWIIDPIDGTVDFMTGFPNYTVSIGFRDEEGLAFGVVANIRQKEVFSAFRGEGAYLNGKSIRTDENTPSHKQLAILVPPHRHHEFMDDYMRRMRNFYEVFSDMRSIGSAACSLCYVACGRVACYYELGLKPYDCAAGIIIVREAGGKVTLIKDSEEWIEIAASSALHHDKVLELASL